jgi:integrase
LEVLLSEQVDRVKHLARTLNRVIPFLFPHLTGPHTGSQIRNFRKAWATACKAVGLVGMLRHDMRRSAVRNMVNRGVPERVAMSITGHKTRAVFDRYHIVSPADLEAAAQKLAGTIPGTVTLNEPAAIDESFASVR